MLLYLDGKKVALEAGKADIQDPGFLYGWGIFETMRISSGKIFRLEEHLQRLKKGAVYIHLAVPPENKLWVLLKGAIRKCPYSVARLRLILWQGRIRPHLGIWVSRLSLKKGFDAGCRVCVSSWMQPADAALSQIKSFNRLHLELSFQEAQKRGFAESLLLNSKGFIAEASRSNMFFVKKDMLLTPSLDCGCLNGITRRVVMELAGDCGLKVREGRFRLRDLMHCQEAFLTNSLRGIRPVIQVEGQRIAKGKPGPLTQLLQKEYERLVEK